MNGLYEYYTQYNDYKFKAVELYQDNIHELELYDGLENICAEYGFGFDIDSEINLFYTEIMENALEFIYEAEGCMLPLFEKYCPKEIIRFRKAVYDITTVTLKEAESDRDKINLEYSRFTRCIREIKQAINQCNVRNYDTMVGTESSSLAIAFGLKIEILCEKIFDRYINKSFRIDERYKPELMLLVNTIEDGCVIKRSSNDGFYDDYDDYDDDAPF